MQLTPPYSALSVTSQPSPSPAQEQQGSPSWREKRAERRCVEEKGKEGSSEMSTQISHPYLLPLGDEQNPHHQSKLNFGALQPNVVMLTCFSSTLVFTPGASWSGQASPRPSCLLAAPSPPEHTTATVSHLPLSSICTGLPIGFTGRFCPLKLQTELSEQMCPA